MVASARRTKGKFRGQIQDDVCVDTVSGGDYEQPPSGDKASLCFLNSEGSCKPFDQKKDACSSYTPATEGDKVELQRKQEEKLDRGIEALLHRAQDDFSPPDWRSIRERLRLIVLYPGRYVAFRDKFEGEGASRRLIDRKVLCASRSLAAVSRQIECLPEQEQREVYIDFVEPTKTRRAAREANTPSVH